MWSGICLHLGFVSLTQDFTHSNTLAAVVQGFSFTAQTGKNKSDLWSDGYLLLECWKVGVDGYAAEVVDEREVFGYVGCCPIAEEAVQNTLVSSCSRRGGREGHTHTGCLSGHVCTNLQLQTPTWLDVFTPQRPNRSSGFQWIFIVCARLGSQRPQKYTSEGSPGGGSEWIFVFIASPEVSDHHLDPVVSKLWEHPFFLSDTILCNSPECNRIQLKLSYIHLITRPYNKSYKFSLNNGRSGTESQNYSTNAFSSSEDVFSGTGKASRRQFLTVLTLLIPDKSSVTWSCETQWVMPGQVQHRTWKPF